MSHAMEALRLSALGLKPIVERPNSKLPLEASWQRMTTRGPDELREAFERAPEGSGIGTVADGFLVVDLDVRLNVNGIESLAALPALPPTLTSITPSGGKHLFFRLPAGVEVKNSVSKIGPGIDIRGTGGQVVLPPTVIDLKPYRWDPAAPEAMADLPQAWLDLLSDGQGAPPVVRSVPTPSDKLRTIRAPADVAFEADRRARYMATLTEPSVQGNNGSAVLMRAAFHAKEMSRDLSEAMGALAGWNKRLADPPWPDGDLIRAINNSEATFGVGLERQKVSGGTNAEEVGHAAEGRESRPASSPASDVAWVESMQAYVARDRKSGVWNLTNPLTEKAAVGALVARGLTAAGARALLKNWQITLATRVDCDPGQPPTFEIDGQVVLNTHVPSTVVPVAGEFPVLSEVLDFLTCRNPAARTWLENWLAFALQNPARPMRTVPVIYGAQRTGKSLMARAMTTLLGEQNCATVRNEDIKGRFTAHFVTKLFVTVGEIEAGEREHATSTLKYLTGEPQLVFEAKGSTAFPVQNRIKMIATSNQTLPVTLEGEADTRWCLFKQLAAPTPEYTARMDSLFDEATNGWSERGRAELAALAQHLLAFPVDAALARSVFVNEARAAAVEASRSSVEQFIDAIVGSSLDAVWLAYIPEHERTTSPFDHMDIAGQPQLTGVSAVYATYRAFCRASGLQPLGSGRFPGELERHAPKWLRHKVSGAVIATRPWAYTGVPRDRVQRLRYLPAELRQQTLGLTPPASAPSAAKAAAIAAMQQTFGLTDPEDES